MAAGMEVCCAAGKPVSFEYAVKGRLETIAGDLQAYMTGDPASGRAIVAIPDIFGLDYPQSQQVCDRLAEAGFAVALVDVFRGKPWSLDRFPPKPEDDLRGWIDSHTWEAVQRDVAATLEVLKARGATKFGSLGFCWGACMGVRAAAAFGMAGTAFLHPTLFGAEAELCGALSCPLITISTPGDPFESIKETMDAKPQGPDCVYKRYDSQIHGFCGARGKFDEPEVAAAAGEATGLVAAFFTRVLAA